jgi:hypothetical protein
VRRRNGLGDRVEDLDEVDPDECNRVADAPGGQLFGGL